MFSKKLVHSLIIITLTIASFAIHAETTLVAVASDFTKPMNEIAAEFQKATGHTAKISYGSSGKFFTQIQNGAPFEVYLSASEKYPALLEKDGLAVTHSSFVFAIGKLVLWSPRENYIDDKAQILTKADFKHLAIANPDHAPYGVVAVEVMKNLGVLEKLKPLFVEGENIAQTFQFVSTGNAAVGFIAFAQVIDVNTGKIGSGSGWLVPDNLHSPFKQVAVLLKKGENNPAAKALLDFLKTPTALAIIKKYGFGLPN